MRTGGEDFVRNKKEKVCESLVSLTFLNFFAIKLFDL